MKVNAAGIVATRVEEPAQEEKKMFKRAFMIAGALAVAAVPAFDVMVALPPLSTKCRGQRCATALNSALIQLRSELTRHKFR